MQVETKTLECDCGRTCSLTLATFRTETARCPDCGGRL